MEAHEQDTIRTRIPARMDRLPWCSWHWLVVLGLGTVWILDGLEVTIVGSIGARLTEKDALGITTSQLGLAGTIYVIGAATGALFWGHLTDRFGRKKLFLLTLGVYLLATVATAFAGSFAFFAVCRFFTGFGIGGEYAAINSAIDELIPARVRGWVDLAINGSYWLGAAFGAAVTPILLNPDLLDANVGWRLTFAMGAVLALGILLVRRNVPESPRWLALHGRNEEAERIVGEIEDHVKEATGRDELPEARDEIELQPRESTGFGEIARTMFGRYPRRSFLGFTLMSTQAFIYNATVFTFTAGLVTFYKVSSRDGAAVPRAVRHRELPRRAAARALLRHDRQAADDRGDLLHLGGRAWWSPASCSRTTACPWACSWRSCAGPSSSRPPPRQPAT